MLSLNKNQNIAARHLNGPMMVLAGPGSGKTTVITHRIEIMVREGGIEPRDILVITFTKSAAEEMKTRFFEMAPDISGVNFGTFHSFFFRVLRAAYGYTTEHVLQEQWRMEMLKSIAARQNRSGEESEEPDEDFLQSLSAEISLVKNELAEIQYYNSPSMGTELFKELYRAYEERKQELNKIDFDDMLTKCHELFTSNPKVLDTWRGRCKYILIDEFQDINSVQYKCMQMLAAPANNIFVVGDDDQSIYKFRGARPEFLLRFPNDFQGAETVILDTNYRSTERIIKASGKVICENKNRYQKQIGGTGRKGGKLSIMTFEDISSEAVGIAGVITQNKLDFDDVAVIYRTNIQARAFADVFRDLKIPYRVKDKMPSIYEHWIAKDICAYIKLSLDRSLDAEAARIINRPTRYVKNKSIKEAKRLGRGVLHGLQKGNVLPYWQIAKIDELYFYLDAVRNRNTYDAYKYIRHAVDYDNYIKSYTEFRKMDSKALFEILDELQEGAKAHPDLREYLSYVETSVKDYKPDVSNDTGVTLSTMHGAKGMEYETVFVAGAVEGVIPHEKSRTEAEIEEERRLLYVAMTRAKENLILSVTRTRYDKDVSATRFVDILRTGKRAE